MKEGLVFTKNTKVLLLAVVIGIAAVGLLHFSYQSKISAFAGRTVKVIGTSKSVNQGTKLTREMLKHLEIPRSSRSDEMYNPGEGTMLIGQPVCVDLAPNTPIQASFIGSVNPDRLGNELDASAHERAFTLNMDSRSTVGGRVKPGDRVDIQWIGQNEAKILLPAVRVLDVQGSLVTFKGTTEEALLLNLAQKKGALGCILRSQEESSEASSGVDTIKVRSDDIFGMSKKLTEVRRQRLKKAKRF
jgi:Flp pilus assembly protein CpaB